MQADSYELQKSINHYQIFFCKEEGPPGSLTPGCSPFRPRSKDQNPSWMADQPVLWMTWVSDKRSQDDSEREEIKNGRACCGLREDGLDPSKP